MLKTEFAKAGTAIFLQVRTKNLKGLSRKNYHFKKHEIERGKFIHTQGLFIHHGRNPYDL